jgi:hypothetical protein
VSLNFSRRRAAKYPDFLTGTSSAPRERRGGSAVIAPRSRPSPFLDCPFPPAAAAQRGVRDLRVGGLRVILRIGARNASRRQMLVAQ